MIFGLLRSSYARVRFVCVQKGSLWVSKYVIVFLEWVRHTLILYPSEHEIELGFINTLDLPLHLALEHFIEAGSFSLKWLTT